MRGGALKRDGKVISHLFNPLKKYLLMGEN
jgi:hypothetical protein